ncbi:hypothetical protein Daus18300_012853 [Diaporthe australafricana]|uniref:NACHT domain-containing protein n=1 Tax=Diaporthe australafricana TaxID=127596 RepID=A0ABR3W1E9_9PEZI
MDPVTAFGLAASVVQFVNFAGGLLNKSIEIHDSVSGLPNALNIQEAYQVLAGLSSSLRDFTDADVSTVDRQIRQDLDSLGALASTCKSDCDTLLDILGKLRIKDGPSRRIKSLRAAFIAFRKEDEIKHLEKRLAESERQISLYFCRISNFYHVCHTRALNDLKEQAIALAVNQDARLDSLASSLEQIKIIVTTQSQELSTTRPELPTLAELEVVRDLMAKLALSERDMAREQVILRSLSYDHHLDRYQSITTAHEKTFSWVFNPANTSSQGKRLVQWLRMGQGVFWVTGKPGSGKSTMMKFLCDHAETTTALQAWACDKSLAIVSHYFWLSGSMMQKSQEGLFRSLLLGIFQRCPELMRKVCPSRWIDAAKDRDIESRHWALDEILAAISTLASFPQFPVKICIFIDGLDEYHGDHVEMCKTLHKLGTASQDIKLCVSSRPWNDFENAFGGGEYLIEMHNLTADDIRRYTRARLSEHWAWTTVAGDTFLADSLINLILSHAEGVFLWVFLVTKEIRDSLSNYDSLADLYRRVEGFPSDLGDFFKHILESVDRFYHAKMSTVLQITLAAAQPLELPIYCLHEQEHTDKNYALTLPIQQPTEDLAEKRCEIIKKRLRGWCKGLLEVHNEVEVHVLHRTARDFLQTEDMATFLKVKAPVDFSADLSIMKAYTAWMKSRTFYDLPECLDLIYTDHDDPSQYVAPFTWMTTRLLSAASQIEKTQEHVSSPVHIEAVKHINEFERTVMELEDQGQITFDSFEGEPATDHEYAARLFRSNILKWELACYLSCKLTDEPGYLRLHDLIPFIGDCSYKRLPDSCFDKLRKVIECALEAGEHQNEQTESHNYFSTPFAQLMFYMGDTFSYWEQPFIRMRLISLFLEYGASPTALNGETYLLELECLFYHGADSEVRIQGQGDGEELPGPPVSAREWFFDQLLQPLDQKLNKRIICQVALMLLQRIKDEAEADAARRVFERALPRASYQCTKSAVAGRKRKRDEERQQR